MVGGEEEITPVSRSTSLGEATFPLKNSLAVSTGSVEGAGGKMSDWNTSACKREHLRISNGNRIFGQSNVYFSGANERDRLYTTAQDFVCTRNFAFGNVEGAAWEETHSALWFARFMLGEAV